MVSLEASVMPRILAHEKIGFRLKRRYNHVSAPNELSRPTPDKHFGPDQIDLCCG